MSNSEKFIGCIKFFGPSVEDGEIDIEKAGRALLALKQLSKNYFEDSEDGHISLKLGKIKKNCTEIDIFMQLIQNLKTPALIYGIAKGIGIEELGKGFFNALGQKLALKIFSKGDEVKIVKEIIFKENNEPYVLLENSAGKREEFKRKIYDSQKRDSLALKDMIQLEKGSEDALEIGYYNNSLYEKVGKVDFSQKKFFEENDLNIQERLEEDFDEQNAKEIKITGKFIDYYGFAHKYHFSFQSRKDQQKIGKQKILCRVEASEISKIIDYLKPENQNKNIHIFGLATKNKEGKIDKMKIEWVSENENFNPNQKSIFS